MHAAIMTMGLLHFARGDGQPTTGPAVPPPWVEQLSAIESNPHYVERCTRKQALFHELRNQRQLDAAMEVYRALGDDVARQEGAPRSQQVALAHAEHLRHRGDLDAACRVARLASDYWPESPAAARAGLLDGQCLRALGRHEEAAERFLRVLEDHDGNPAAAIAWEQMARSYQDAGRIDDAIAALETMRLRFEGQPQADTANELSKDIRRGQ